MVESTSDRMDRQYRAEEAARQRGDDPAFPFVNYFVDYHRARERWDEGLLDVPDFEFTGGPMPRAGPTGFCMIAPPATANEEAA